MKNILVTGGAGYVGAVLVPKLIREGYKVDVLDLFLFADSSIFPSKLLNGGNLRLFRGDLCHKDFVKKSLKNIDCVIHLAGISNDPSSDLDPELTRRVNIDGTKQLIDLARDSGISRFINASSSSVYGIKEEPDVTEDLPLDPLTIYSQSKQIIEDYLHEKRGNMISVSIRSATVCGYSPRMRLDLTVNILTHHALTKGKITVFGGTQRRPNIHIEDITDLYVQMVEMPRNLIDGKEFNASAANHTVMQLAECVKDAVAPGVPIEVVPTDDLRSYHISADRIQKDLGFIARHPIEEAICDVANAIRQGKIPHSESSQYYNVRVMKEQLTRGAILAQ